MGSGPKDSGYSLREAELMGDKIKNVGWGQIAGKLNVYITFAFRLTLGKITFGGSFLTD